VPRAERLEGRERVAADVGRNVHAPDLLLRQLQRREHRPLGAADAKPRRTRRQRADPFRDGVTALRVAGQPGPGGRQVDRRQVVLAEAHQALGDHLDGVLARRGQQILAVHRRGHVELAQCLGDVLLDVLGVAFLDDEHRVLADAERADLAGHQRVGDVEHQDRNLALAEGRAAAAHAAAH
jgi:hypothetical protein